MSYNCKFGVISLFFVSALGAASDLENAPPPFSLQNSLVVPMDFQDVSAAYDFNWQTRTTSGTSKINFEVGTAGFPMFLLNAKPTAVTLDGNTLNASDVVNVVSPHRSTTVWVLKKDLKPGDRHEMVVDFTLNQSDVTYASNGAVRCGFFMSDLDRVDFGGVRFYEQYGPANFEFDRYRLSFDVKISGTNTEHVVYANGDIVALEKNRFQIDFPEYFNSSSPYFHLVDKGAFFERDRSFNSLNGQEIPAKVYAATSSDASRAITNTIAALSEMEKNFGATIHKKIVIYSTSRFPGGMEHAGATITNERALSHEVSHFWFGRGMAPANGNSGWVDEAVASWRDNNYPLRTTPGSSPANLSGYSPYKRSTEEAAYKQGASLIAYLAGQAGSRDRAFGMLKDIYLNNSPKIITTESFKAELEDFFASDLTALFRNWVYGAKNQAENTPSDKIESEQWTSHHPRPFTLEELQALR